jgi:hypothetical protein
LKFSSSTGNVTFTNSSIAVIAAATRLKKRGVNIIIVLSHCGYDAEIEMAGRANGLVDVIVGGHSHSYLHNGPELPTGDPIKGPYPTVVQQGSHKVRGGPRFSFRTIFHFRFPDSSSPDSSSPDSSSSDNPSLDNSSHGQFFAGQFFDWTILRWTILRSIFFQVKRTILRRTIFRADNSSTDNFSHGQFFDR